MKILFATAPGYGLTLPVVPLIWAAHAEGHEVLVATTGEMTEVGARAGLPTFDVYPQRDVWQELVTAVGKPDRDDADLPEELRLAMRSNNPFGLFTATMTGGTIDAGRLFEPDLVVHTSDHAAGALAARALDRPALEVGNRISWSLRDRDFRERRPFGDDELTALVRERHGIPDGPPRVLARIDPRAPSMGGLVGDEPDPADGVPWWAMRFVPYNGGAVLPEWVLTRPDRPRVLVTLGTVVPVVSGISSLAVVVEALGGMDVEVVLAAGSADLSSLGELPANVRSAGFLPLSAVLPTTSVIVHHGGSGTTAAPLHHGVPQLVLPAFADNPMSAQRVVDRGVGLAHDPSTVDTEVVRGLVRRLLDEPEFGKAAAEVRAELATQPTPTSVITRVAALLG